MAEAAVPALSVVVATPSGFDAIRETVRHLRAQTVRPVVELVVVATTSERLRLDASALEGFAAYQVVELGTLACVGAANAAGVRRASAPIVAFAEDHSFTDPDWAERILARFEQPYAAVGPAVRNANPRTSLSWADFLIGYGLWADPAKAGEVDTLPGHNSSYRRDLLLAYGDRLESMLETETLLHWDLRSRGHRLYLEAGARVAHANFSRVSSWTRAHFFNGRLFAGRRARAMSAAVRVVYVVGAPLIPFVRLARISAASPPLRPRLLRALPAVLAGLALDAAGQMIGYACGPGTAGEEIARIEADRARHVTAEDRRDLWGDLGEARP